MRGLLVIPFLLMAGTSAAAQPFSFNVGGQPIVVDVRGYCPDCITVVVPGYAQYSRRHYYDYEVPYVGRQLPHYVRARRNHRSGNHRSRRYASHCPCVRPRIAA